MTPHVVRRVLTKRPGQSPRRAQSIIELLIALVVLTVVFLASTDVLEASLSASQLAKTRRNATEVGYSVLARAEALGCGDSTGVFTDTNGNGSAVDEANAAATKCWGPLYCTTAAPAAGPIPEFCNVYGNSLGDAQVSKLVDGTVFTVTMQNNWYQVNSTNSEPGSTGSNAVVGAPAMTSCWGDPTANPTLRLQPTLLVRDVTVAWSHDSALNRIGLLNNSIHLQAAVPAPTDDPLYRRATDSVIAAKATYSGQLVEYKSDPSMPSVYHYARPLTGGGFCTAFPFVGAGTSPVVNNSSAGASYTAANIASSSLVSVG